MICNFSPLLRFVCRLCKEIFPDTDRLNQHKLEHHLGDCMKIKCIIFEEKYLDQEFIPGDSSYFFDQNTNLYPGTDSLIIRQTGSDSGPRNSFMNPFVSLKRLTPEQLTKVTCKNEENDWLNNIDQRCMKRKSTRLQSKISVSPLVLLQNKPPPSKKRKYSYKNQRTFSEARNYHHSSSNQSCVNEGILIQPKVERVDVFTAFDPQQTELVFEQDAGIYNSNSDPIVDTSNYATEIYLSQIQSQVSDRDVNDLVTRVKDEYTLPQYEIVKNEIFDTAPGPEPENEDQLEESHRQTKFEFQENIREKNQYQVNQNQCQGHNLYENESELQIGERFVCQFCSVEFQFRCRLRTHILTVHRNEKLFNCTQCPGLFKLKSLEKTGHSGLNPFRCPICKETFDFLYLLQDHLMTHSNKFQFDERPYKCQYCLTDFKTKKNADVHISNCYRRC